MQEPAAIARKRLSVPLALGLCLLVTASGQTSTQTQVAAYYHPGYSRNYAWRATVNRGAAMKGQGRVKGILIEGNDGQEYLLGFGPDNSPIFSCRQANGTFEPLEDVWRASKVAITQIGHTGGLIGPGMGNRTWLGGAFRAALEAFPSIPTWPTLSS